MCLRANETYYRSLVFAVNDHPNSSGRPYTWISYAPGGDNFYIFQYSGCNGVDAVISSCGSMWNANLNFGASQEFDAWPGLIMEHYILRSLIYWALSQKNKYQRRIVTCWCFHYPGNPTTVIPVISIIRTQRCKPRKNYWAMEWNTVTGYTAYNNTCKPSLFSRNYQFPSRIS